MEKKLKVAMISAEVDPFAKAGGLGDVVGSLPKALNTLEVDCRVIMPLYKTIKKEYKDKMTLVDSVHIAMRNMRHFTNVYKLRYNTVNIYFLDCFDLFDEDSIYSYKDLEKFSFLSYACFEVLKKIKFKPDIMHIHDWHTGIVATLLKENYANDDFFKKTKCVYTIHNLAYQGKFDTSSVLKVLPLNENNYGYYNDINFMYLGIRDCDAVTTVSDSYAKEILTQQYGEGLHWFLKENEYKLSGILNGLDYDVYDSSKDKLIYKQFNQANYKTVKLENKKMLLEELGFASKDLSRPLIGIVSRLAGQKGMDLLLKILGEVLYEDVNVVLLGSGEQHLEQSFRNVQERHDNFKAILKYDNTLAHKIYASIDLFLMPSAFEPCGLAQMICLRYATIPLVRSTGGLKDSIVDYESDTQKGNGFVFYDFNENELYRKILEALALYKDKHIWNKIIKNGFNYDFSWTVSAKKYKQLYLNLLNGANK